MKYKDKRTERQDAKGEEIKEPVRPSILSVVQTNLKISKRSTFLHRLIYIAEHTCPQSSVSEAMENNYRQSNSGYYTESLAGILLIYPKYLCCIVEGSEEILYKHLKLLFEQDEAKLLNVKLLCAVHHVKGRFCNEWMSYCGRPAERVEEIDPDSNLDNSMRYVTECCKKLYNFSRARITDLKKRSKSDTIESVDKSAEEIGSHRRSKSFIERDPYIEYLPEVKLLQFLTNCKHLKDVRQFRKYYEYIGQSFDYDLKQWPAPKNLIPYNVFEKAYDPIDNLPNSLEKDIGEGASEATSE